MKTTEKGRFTLCQNVAFCLKLRLNNYPNQGFSKGAMFSNLNDVFVFVFVATVVREDKNSVGKLSVDSFFYFY